MQHRLFARIDAWWFRTFARIDTWAHLLHPPGERLICKAFSHYIKARESRREKVLTVLYWFTAGFLAGIASICTLLAAWAFFWPEKGRHE